MRIGVDARPLQTASRYRGIGKFADALLHAMTTASSAHEYVLYVDPELPAPLFTEPALARARQLPVAPDPATRVRWVRRFAPELSPVRPDPADVDAFLQVDAAGGVPDVVPTVVVFHDAIPLLFVPPPPGRSPEALAGWWLDRNRYRTQLRAHRRAALVATISRSSAEDYLKHVESRPGKVRIVGSAPMDLARGTDGPGPHRDRQPYLLYAGGTDTRKNVVQLLADLRTLRSGAHPGLSLVVAGKDFEKPHELEVSGWADYLRRHPELADGVVIAGFVSDEELAGLYRDAAVFVFPSRYEGFGLPVLEAMAYGCPVVCYDNSALPEVAGTAAVVVPDAEPMADAVGRLLSAGEAERAERIRAGRRQAARFTWGKVGPRVLDLFEELRGQTRRREGPARHALRRVREPLLNQLAQTPPFRL